MPKPSKVEKCSDSNTSTHDKKGKTQFKRGYERYLALLEELQLTWCEDVSNQPCIMKTFRRGYRSLAMISPSNEVARKADIFRLPTRFNYTESLIDDNNRQEIDTHLRGPTHIMNKFSGNERYNTFVKTQIKPWQEFLQDDFSLDEKFLITVLYPNSNFRLDLIIRDQANRNVNLTSDKIQKMGRQFFRLNVNLFLLSGNEGSDRVGSLDFNPTNQLKILHRDKLLHSFLTRNNLVSSLKIWKGNKKCILRGSVKAVDQLLGLIYFQYGEAKCRQCIDKIMSGPKGMLHLSSDFYLKSVYS